LVLTATSKLYIYLAGTATALGLLLGKLGAAWCAVLQPYLCLAATALLTRCNLQAKCVGLLVLQFTLVKQVSLPKINALTVTLLLPYAYSVLHLALHLISTMQVCLTGCRCALLCLPTLNSAGVQQCSNTSVLCLRWRLVQQLGAGAALGLHGLCTLLGNLCSLQGLHLLLYGVIAWCAYQQSSSIYSWCFAPTYCVL
jgi:hypothetical protein